MKNQQVVGLILIVSQYLVCKYDASPIKPAAGNPSKCAIKFFDGEDFGDEFLETSQHNGLSHVHIHEESIQTFGNCCWRLFS